MRIGILVVADHEASFFEIHGGTVVRPIERVDDPQWPARDGASAQPGVSYEVNASILARINAAGFAQRVADAIQGGRSRHEFERLIVMAAPPMLALIREALPAASRNVIAAEIPNEFAGLEAEAIREHMPSDMLTAATH